MTKQEKLVLKYLARFIAALWEDRHARDAMRTLIASGGNPVFIWTLMLAFYDGQFADIHAKDREAAKAFHRTMKAVVQKLKIVEVEFEQVPTEYREAASHLLNQITPLRKAVENEVLPLLKKAGDARGYLRPEMQLARVIHHIKTSGGKAHYAQFSDLLNCLARSDGSEENFDPENIRKTYLRYKKNLTSGGPALLNSRQSIESIESSEASPIITRWLLDAISVEAHPKTISRREMNPESRKRK